MSQTPEIQHFFSDRSNVSSKGIKTPIAYESKLKQFQKDKKSKHQKRRTLSTTLCIGTILPAESPHISKFNSNSMDFDDQQRMINRLKKENNELRKERNSLRKDFNISEIIEKKLRYRLEK